MELWSLVTSLSWARVAILNVVYGNVLTSPAIAVSNKINQVLFRPANKNYIFKSLTTGNVFI